MTFSCDPKRGQVPIEKIDQRGIKMPLEPVWHTKAETARKALNCLPEGAAIEDLHQRRFEAVKSERIDKALLATEEANGTKLRDVFQDICFTSNKLRNEQQKNDTLRQFME